MITIAAPKPKAKPITVLPFGLAIQIPILFPLALMFFDFNC
jgi:hypothetical protein